MNLPAIAAAPMLALATAFFSGKAYAAEQKPALTLIIDSSRSMWGQIEGINKVVSVRTVIDEMAKRYTGKLDFGVIAYGHRQSAGCRDVEVLLPPGPHSPDKIAATVNSIKPKGSTPIATALEEAAEAAKFTENEETALLLVSDGLDNCRGDPCAVAEALKAKAAGLKIHVVAFDHNDQEELKALSCIADKTGGIFASAISEQQLLAAAMKIAETVTAPPMPKVAEKPEPAPTPAPPAPQPKPARAPEPTPTAPATPDQPQTEPPAEPGQLAKADKGETPVPASPEAPVPVTFSARLTEGGAKLQSGLVWRVFETLPNNGGKYKLIATHHAATPSDALPPGEYLVNAAYGLAHLTKRIQVQAGRSIDETFVLNAGGVRLDSVLTNGASIPPNSVRYDIFTDEADQFGNRKKILGDAKPGLIIRLNAGVYHIVSVYGDANAVVRADVAVEPGRLTEATINHSAAKVTFKLVLQAGGEALADTQWNILTPSGDVVKESVGALPTHILAAGSYSVLARHGGKNYTRDFEVKSGDVTQIEVVVR